jgi:hypothetical protein
MRSRTFGWVQDAADFAKLRTVLTLFDSTINVPVIRTIKSKLKIDPGDKVKLVARISQPNFRAGYSELIGSKGKSNGLLPIILPGQTAGKEMADWPCRNFLVWAHALNFLDYDRTNDNFGLTAAGVALLQSAAGSTAEIKLFQEGLAASPPVFRILSLLSAAGGPMTRYELGAELGFAGEPGFTSIPQAMVVRGIQSGSLKGLSDIEGTSDKYARTICNWMIKLGLVKNANTSRTGIAQIEYELEHAGQSLLTHIRGRSKHSALTQHIYWEMLATVNAPGRDHVRNYRSAIIRIVQAKRQGISIDDLRTLLVNLGFAESKVTLLASLNGLRRIGVQLTNHQNTWKLSGRLILDAPSTMVNNAVTTEYEDFEKLRTSLPNTDNKYLSLLALSVGGRADSIAFETLLMEYLNQGLSLPGFYLGGQYKPDGIVYLNKRGAVIDAKAYTKGYGLGVADQRAMGDYVRECRDRLVMQGQGVSWWAPVPTTVTDFAFSFVSSDFLATTKAGLGNVSKRLGGVPGTAILVEHLLLTGESFLAAAVPIADRIDLLFFTGAVAKFSASMPSTPSAPIVQVVATI